MAIAYFIPDQTKLIAGGNSGSNAHATTTAQSQQPHSLSGAPGSGPPSPSSGDGTPNASHLHHTQQQHNIRANITIPLPPYAGASQQNVGCWDLITQVFCQALRFCHETRLNPAVIEISFEFSGELSNSITANATTTPPTMAATVTSPSQQNNASLENSTTPTVRSSAVPTANVRRQDTASSTGRRGGGHHQSRQAGAPRRN